MHPLSNDLINGYVVHHRPYRETSVIADFFTESEGRLSAVVRGVRKAKSEKKSLIQGFQPLCFKLSGKSELKTLTHVEAHGNAIQLSGANLFCGMYMNELIVRLLPVGVVTEYVYVTYADCLDALRNSNAPDIVMRQFEFAMLEELGVMPDFSCDAETGEPVLPEHQYYFSSDKGFYGNNGVGQRFEGAIILQVLNRIWTPESRKMAKLLCRQMFVPILGDKPLHSRALFQPGR